MAFAIKFQNTTSEPIKIDKEVTDVLVANGAFRDECSIMNPILLVEGSLVDFTTVNYCTIESLGRSYFVTDIASYRNNLLSITCRIDVLTSFKSQIRANKGIVHRQENNYNLYLNDGALRVYGNPITNTIAFPKGFEGQSFVMLVAGKRDGGIELQGGTYNDEQSYAGAGNTEEKTTNGLRLYAEAQVGLPYWFGTYGQTASQLLLDRKTNQYPSYYTDTDFVSQIGQRVHDCVGLVKGYRWSETPTSAPSYVASQDVNVRGLYAQCNIRREEISPNSTPIIGSVVFTSNLSHCGVYVGSGYVVEARGHAYGVQRNLLSDRNFTLWGIPDWLQVTT